MPWIIGGAALGGALLSSSASRRGAASAEAAANAATAEQRRQFDQLRQDQAPFREAGYAALQQLRELMNYDPTPTAEAVVNEPGYQFGMQQGRNALEGSAAARGGLYSGQALKELTQFGNDYGSTKYGDAWNRAQQGFGNRWGRISALAGVGQSATNQVGQAGMNYANSVGNIGMNNANVQAASGMQRASIWGNGLNQLAGMAAWNRQPGQTGSGANWAGWGGNASDQWYG